MSCCSRCNKEIPITWEHGWPLYGQIHLGFPGQTFAVLSGDNIASFEHFKAWERSHPAMIKDEAQEVIFQWGNGYRYESRDRYRLCYDCQKELVKLVGGFFGYGKQEVAK